MGTHRRIGEAFEHGVDITASLDELEKTIVETLAEVELARRGGSYPWDTQRRGKHAGPARGTCATCKGAVLWQACSTGGWWIHEAYPADRHDAAVAA